MEAYLYNVARWTQEEDSDYDSEDFDSHEIDYPEDEDVIPRIVHVVQHVYIPGPPEPQEEAGPRKTKLNDATLEEFIGEGSDPILPENSTKPQCIGCKEKESNVVFLLCGHMCVCRDCARGIAKNDLKCPMCRTVPVRIARVFST